MNDIEREHPLSERSIPQIVEVLSVVLDPMIVAYALDIELPYVGAFAMDIADPSKDQVSTIRNFARVTEILLERRFDGETIEALMFGQNSCHQGEAPIALIREGRGEEVVEAAPFYLTGYSKSP